MGWKIYMEKQQKEGEHFGLTKDMYQPEFDTIGTCGCGPWTGTNFWNY